MHRFGEYILKAIHSPVMMVHAKLRDIRHIFYISLSASHTGLTTMLRPSCDLKMLEFWEDRRLIA